MKNFTKAILCIVILLSLLQMMGCKNKSIDNNENQDEELSEKEYEDESQQLIEKYEECCIELDNYFSKTKEETGINVTGEGDFDNKKYICKIDSMYSDDDINTAYLWNTAYDYESKYLPYQKHIIKAFENKGLNDFTLTLQIYTSEKTLFLEYENKLTKYNLISDKIKSKPSTRDNPDVLLARWGDDINEVLKYITTDGLTYDGIDLYVPNMEFGGYSATLLYEFSETGELVSVGYMFPDDSSSASYLIARYNSIKESLCSIYGDANTDEIVKLSSLANYTDEESAFQFGFTAYQSNWTSDKNNIDLSLLPASLTNDVNITLILFSPK